MDAVVSFLALSLILTLINLLLSSLPPNPNPNIPPSPPSFPIIGHLHLFKKPLHHTLARLSARHGPILSLRFGSRPVLVVSSLSLAEECFTTNDIAFANRPRFIAGKHLSYNYTSLTTANYGPHWRNIRRISTVELLSTHRLNAFAAFRAAEARATARRLFRESNSNIGFARVEIKSRLFELMLNVLMSTIAGKRYYGEEGGESEGEVQRFHRLIADVLSLGGASNIGDFIPVLKWVDFNGLRRKLVRLQRGTDEFLQGLIEEHRIGIGIGIERGEEEEEKKKKTMIGVLLKLQESDPEYYTDHIIKALMLSLLSAGTGTTSDTIEWGMTLLLNNPHTLSKLSEEINAQAEKGRLLQESDLSNLPYLHCIINETLRLYPAGPLLVPHESSQECVVGGFDIPRGTLLLGNAYAIQRDPAVWEEPNKFLPERFSEAGEGRKMIPFGLGRRRCPGEALAMRLTGLVLGTLVQCFEWERVGKEAVDMSEGSGITIPKAIPLEAMYKPRQTMIDVLSVL